MTIHESHHTWAAEIDSSGRLLIPAEARDAIGCNRGADVVVECDGDSLRVLTLDRFTKEVQAAFNPFSDGESLNSTELIHDRREDAKRARCS